MRKLLWILLPLLLALLLGYLALPYVAARVLGQWLAEQGFSEPEIEFSHPGWNRLDIPRLNLVQQGSERRIALQAQQISVFFDPLELYAGGRISELRIPRLQLQIDARENLEQRLDEAAQTRLDLNATPPSLLFDLAPSERLAIGQLQLTYRAPQQPPLQASGNVDLSADQLQSRLALTLHPEAASASDGAPPATDTLPAYLDLTFNRAQALSLQLTREAQTLAQFSGALQTGTERWQLALDGKLTPTPLLAWLAPLLPGPLPAIAGEQALTLQLAWPAQLPPQPALLLQALEGQLENRGSITLPPEWLPAGLQIEPLKATTLALQLQGATVDAALTLPALSARLNGTALPPLALNAQGRWPLSQTAIEGQARIAMRAPDATISADWQWRDERLQLQWRSTPIALPGLQPLLRKLLPALDLTLPKALTLKRGQLNLNGRLEQQSAGLDAQTRVTLSNGALGWADTLAAAGISAQLTLQQRPGGSIAAAGRLGAEQIDVGLPLALPAVDFNFRQPARGRSSLSVAPVRLELLGGAVSFPALTLDPAAPRLDSTVRLEGIALSQILALYQQPGLTGDIRLRGSLPLRLEGSALSIRGGQLYNDGGGWLRYAAAPAVQQSAAGNPGLQLALGALSNLQIERLQVDVDYAEQGDLELSCRFQGHNPDWQQGRAIDLTLNLEENLPMLLKSLQFAGQIDDSVNRRLTR